MWHFTQRTTWYTMGPNSIHLRPCNYYPHRQTLWWVHWTPHPCVLDITVIQVIVMSLFGENHLRWLGMVFLCTDRIHISNCVLQPRYHGYNSPIVMTHGHYSRRKYISFRYTGIVFTVNTLRNVHFFVAMMLLIITPLVMSFEYRYSSTSSWYTFPSIQHRSPPMLCIISRCVQKIVSGVLGLRVCFCRLYS